MGPDDKTHLRNLAAVLNRLQHHRVCTKNAKCCYMANDVSSLLRPQGRPACTSIQQLCLFIGQLSKIPSQFANNPTPPQLTASEEHFLEMDIRMQMVLKRSCVVKSSVLAHYNHDLPPGWQSMHLPMGYRAVVSHVIPHMEQCAPFHLPHAPYWLLFSKSKGFISSSSADDLHLLPTTSPC